MLLSSTNVLLLLVWWAQDEWRQSLAVAQGRRSIAVERESKRSVQVWGQDLV